MFSPALLLGEFLFGIIYFICAPSFFPTYASSTFSFLSLEPCAAMPILKSVLFANMAPFAHVFWVRYLVTVSLQDTCLVFLQFCAMFITKHYKLKNHQILSFLVQSHASSKSPKKASQSSPSSIRTSLAQVFSISVVLNHMSQVASTAVFP